MRSHRSPVKRGDDDGAQGVVLNRPIDADVDRVPLTADVVAGTDAVVLVTTGSKTRVTKAPAGTQPITPLPQPVQSAPRG